MTIPDQIIRGARECLSKTLQQDLTIDGFIPCGGGCINHGGKIQTSNGDYFIKWNDATRYPNMFNSEASGLNLLTKANAVRIPRQVGVDVSGSLQFIIMEFIQSKSRSIDYWELLGRGLATLHRTSAPAYGLDHDNYIGSLPQVNLAKPSWVEFFITERLEVQIRIGTNSRALDLSVVKKFEGLYTRLPTILHEEKPTLLHGDLWSGNLMTDDKGQPCLIDPATYYGHREVDLAMTQLFGGFSEDFYRSYQNAFPLERGFHERFDLYNLYPLLVHVNLFGQGYMSQLLSILKRYQ